MNIKQALAALSFLLPISAPAQIFETFLFSPNLAVPDGNATGVSDTRSISMAATEITSLHVSLDIESEFNGDLYLYLRHDSGFSVLLNRVGRDAGDPFGYGDGGFNLVLRDDADHNVHTYQDQTVPGAGFKLTGEWRPDGRAVDPSLVTSSDPSTTPLSSFHGLDPNGEWTLFAADLMNGGSSQINSWGLAVTAVPEPGTITLLSSVALLGFGAFRHRRRAFRGNSLRPRGRRAAGDPGEHLDL